MAIYKSLCLCASVFVFTALTATAQSLRNQTAPKPLTVEKGGKITYQQDSLGNQILDYSFCGYRQSDVKIPDAPVVIFVPWEEGDLSAKIQTAIDNLSVSEPDKKTGIRGAVLLGKGVFSLSEPLRINASGVVLRGMSKTETILQKEGVDRGAVVYLEGQNDRQIIDTLRITDNYVPVGSNLLTLENLSSLDSRLSSKNLSSLDSRLSSKNLSSKNLSTLDSRLLIVRPSTKEWIASVGCDVFGGSLGYWGWKPGEMDVLWDRSVKSVEEASNLVRLDAPLTVALDKKWGESYALLYQFPGRIKESGVENLTIKAKAAEGVSNGDKNEDHAWDGVYIEAAEDCWVRQCNFLGLAGSAVIIHRNAQQITVEDCISKAPCSEIGGLRRRTFLTMGGKCLFQRCYSEEGINDFSAGYCAPGPNAFVQCDAVDSHGFSGSSSSWATGLLFDNVNIENGSISFKNLGLEKWGAGWNTANSVLWQSTASQIDSYDVSDDARCYAFGCWSYCQGTGYWTSSNDHIQPRSLFAAQLKQRRTENIRKGVKIADVIKEVDAQCRILERSTDASSSPSVDVAQRMAQEALNPRVTLEDWISQSPFTASVSNKNAYKLNFDDASYLVGYVEGIKITNGVFTYNGKEMMGSMYRTPWWNGRTRYPYMDKASMAVTRFVPGMEQRGGTDRINDVVENLGKLNVCVWNQNYGLWYDRRRDDHERIKRLDGDVWAPFFEQIFQRSGEGKAWDGLSKYDLTKLNPWYIHRVKQLARRMSDMIVINQHLFQHNILEAGAHWVDCPWRTANNINSTGFLEPVPFTGDKRIFTADAFYDVTSSPEARHRGKLYKQYFFQQLDSFADNDNVYHSISEEYTGPLHFTEFWLDCVAEWNAKTGKHARIILNANKDVTEAVLNNPKYNSLVDAIEIEQWFYDGSLTSSKNTTYDASLSNGQGDSCLYAPKGGQNLAPRQHLRLTKTGHPTFFDCYHAVAEMRQKYPSKAVLYYAKEYDRNPWGVLMAGGSCPAINPNSFGAQGDELLKVLPTLKPVYPNDLSVPSELYIMEGDAGTLIYNPTSAPQTYSPTNVTINPNKYVFVKN